MRLSRYKNENLLTKRLDSIVLFSKGNGLSKDDLNDDGKLCILYGELYTKYLGKIDKIFSRTNVLPSNPKYSKAGDIIMPLSGETPLDISNSAVVPIDGIVLGSDLLVMTPKDGFNSLFLSYYISNCRKKEIARKACGISIIHLHKHDIEKLVINYPSIYEQNDISQIISKMDKKINIISNKINTLKKYKKGISINILKKLDSYDSMSLSKLCNVTTGKLDANAMTVNGKYKFFTCSREDYTINNYAFDCEALLISGNGEVGLTKYYKGKFNAYQRTYVLYNFKRNAKFIKMCIDNQISTVIKKETNKGAMPYIKLTTFDKILIPLISKSVENNIEAIINIIDKKIELLENSLKALNLIKKQLLNSMFI